MMTAPTTARASERDGVNEASDFSGGVKRATR
jgi:hypothetical protein